MPSLVEVGQQRTAAGVATLVRQGAGRMPGFPGLQQNAVDAIVQYLMTGEETRPDASTESPIAPKYRFTGYRRFMDPDGYPAGAPTWGTLSAIDLNTGDDAWRGALGEYPELTAEGLRHTR